MSHWIRVCAVRDLLPGAAREVLAGERLVAMFRVGDRFLALDGLCPHQGGPLGRGCLQGTTVTCPWHGWQFDVVTGAHAANASLRQPCLAVKVEGEDVFVDQDS